MLIGMFISHVHKKQLSPCFCMEDTDINNLVLLVWVSKQYSLIGN